jgi:hypothetical protein
MDDNFKDLKKLIKLCQGAGIKSITYDGVAIEFGDQPLWRAPSNAKRQFTGVDLPDLPGSEMEQLQVPAPQIEDDGLTDEELLLYSVREQNTGNE